MLLGIVGWIVVGLVIGFVTSKVVNLRGDDPRLGIAAAVGGAVVAGALFSMISGGGVTAWNVWGLLCAAGGAVVGVVLWHLIRSRTISHTRYVPRRSY
jgi:uncharacterized membrane protein YeaQ/YmgE (transglycosylase-associated protein family)